MLISLPGCYSRYYGEPTEEHGTIVDTLPQGMGYACQRVNGKQTIQSTVFKDKKSHRAWYAHGGLAYIREDNLLMVMNTSSFLNVSKIRLDLDCDTLGVKVKMRTILGNAFEADMGRDVCFSIACGGEIRRGRGDFFPACRAEAVAPGSSTPGGDHLRRAFSGDL